MLQRFTVLFSGGDEKTVFADDFLRIEPGKAFEEELQLVDEDRVIVAVFDARLVRAITT